LALGVGVGVEVGLLNIRPIFGHLLKRRKRRRTDGIMESGSFLCENNSQLRNHYPEKTKPWNFFLEKNS
jgi:hypothetical protein